MIHRILVILLIHVSISFNHEIAMKLDGNVTNETIIRIENKFSLRFKRNLFDDFYLFHDDSSKKYQKRDVHHSKEFHDEQIKWAQVQTSLARDKRHYLMEDTLSSNNFLKTQKPCNQTSTKLNDPYWPYQWYLNDGCDEGLHMNITQAWRQGYTGKGVVLSIIDDGIEHRNNELDESFDAKASVDLNERDFDPQPRYDSTNENKHGTRCAGEIVAKANNSFCGVGVAYNARVGGIRLLDGTINDRLEAEALMFNLNYIDIFSASWGPLDNGQTVEGPGMLTRAAFEKGIREGRRGKGTLYVWASGNGGRFQDNCNCDGYISSIYTITISSATRDHHVPVYSEKCTSILASTYSSGDSLHSNIITSDLHNMCTRSHSGTSASAPIAAGIIALTLESNPTLTWRDIQYLIIYSADSSKLSANTKNKWILNGIGRRVSHNFGYGLMNAGKMIELAKRWRLVSKQLTCQLDIISPSTNSYEIEPKQTGIFKIKIISTLNFTSNDTRPFRLCNQKINSLEHVQALITLESQHRGALQIVLVSPIGTQSNLLDLRKNDLSTQGFHEWPFMSVFYWNENPNGEWTLRIKNNAKTSCKLKKWSLRLYGVEHFNSI